MLDGEINKSNVNMTTSFILHVVCNESIINLFHVDRRRNILFKLLYLFKENKCNQSQKRQILTEILPIWRRTLCYQSIDQSINTYMEILF